MAQREKEHVELPIPNGWFAVEFSRELREGDVKPVHYCGEDLVLFRTRSGEARVLDAFCPHLGAHLGYGGRVMAETLRCPFHAWQFDGTTGGCTHIPYSERIPANAKVRAWDVQEKNGFIWIWYHSEGEAPQWDFPEQPAFENTDWSEPRAFEVVLESHIQDTHENNNDAVHFHYVHGAAEIPESTITFTPDSTHYRISSSHEADYPFGKFTMTLVRDSWGLGLNCMSMEGIPEVGLMMFAATTPIDANSVHSRWLLTASRNMVDLAGEEFMKNITAGVEQDLDIWKHKVHRANPVFCEGDGQLADYRKWARQFYSQPVGDVRQPGETNMNRHLVISSDGHAGPHAAEYRDYVDPEFREMFDIALPIQIEMTEAAAKSFLVADINREWRKGRDYELSGAWDAEARDKVLDADGVAAEVLFPDGVTEMNAPPFGAGFSMGTENVTADLQWAGSIAHNRWMAEFVATAPERRIGLACIPVLWDIDRAVEGIRWARENGLRGVVFPPRWGSFDAYHHSRYDPVWEICQDLDMPIHFHSGPAPIEEYFGPVPAPEGHAVQPGAMGIYITEVAMWLTRPLTFMLWGGVFERFPKLKVAIVEGTSVWVPEYLELLEQRYSVTHYSQKLGDYHSHLSMSPADYFRRNVRVGASCMPRREAELRYAIGLENIMWGTDYPHPEGSWPYTKDQMHTTFDGLPEQEIGKMLGGNAAEFYGIDTEKLAPLVARIGPEKAHSKLPVDPAWFQRRSEPGRLEAQCALRLNHCGAYVKDYTGLAGPAYFILIAVELWVAKRRRVQVYRLNDALNDVSTGILMQLAVLGFGGLIVASYIGVYEAWRLTDWSPDSITTWLACFLCVDFVYYWFHRLSHEINFLWAAHVVHHQSEDYNLAVALRQSTLQPFFSCFFYLALALVGFPPLVFFACSAINTIYQFWLHTQLVGNLGPFEEVFVTPSHHRVHHGRNPIYIDRNHGGTFIVWDRLFGTFQREEEEVVYGITKPLASWNPIWANLHYWVELAGSAGRAFGLADKLRIFLKAPGWFPADQGGPQPPPAIEAEPAKFDRRYPPELGAYVFVQFALITAVAVGMLFMVGSYGFAVTLVGATVVIWGLVNLGGLFETSAWAYRSEVVRVAVVPLAPLVLLSGPAALAWSALLSLGLFVFLYRMPGLRSNFLELN